jgi:hypothetical protein
MCLVSDCAPVRMTGLIAATSPLRESAALHNCVVQTTRGCAARPCERSAELASGRRSSMQGSSCNCPVPGDHHLGLGQQHRMGQGRCALRTQLCTLTGTTMPACLPKWVSQSKSAYSDCRPARNQPSAKVLRLSQQRTPAAPEAVSLVTAKTAAWQNDDPALAHREGACSIRLGTYRRGTDRNPTASTAASSAGCCTSPRWRCVVEAILEGGLAECQRRP